MGDLFAPIACRCFIGELTMAISNHDQKLQSVLIALNNPEYEWRTIPGISQETHIEPEETIEILGKLRANGLVIQSNTPSRDGKELFISRDKFNERSSLGEKILGAIKNRIG
jgi:hypothetical protein